MSSSSNGSPLQNFCKNFISCFCKDPAATSKRFTPHSPIFRFVWRNQSPTSLCHFQQQTFIAAARSSKLFWLFDPLTSQEELRPCVDPLTSQEELRHCVDPSRPPCAATAYGTCAWRTMDNRSNAKQLKQQPAMATYVPNFGGDVRCQDWLLLLGKQRTVLSSSLCILFLSLQSFFLVTS